MSQISPSLEPTALPNSLRQLQQWRQRLFRSSEKQDQEIRNYQELLSNKERERSGIFYTPPTLADRIVQETLQLDSAIPSPTVLDPACGTGVFLVSAFRKLLQCYRPASSAEATRLLTNSIFGVDRDAYAIELCKLHLVEELLQWSNSHSLPLESLPSLGRNIRVGNGILDSAASQESTATLDGFDWQRGFPAIVQNQCGFDYILGNPPFGLARDGRLSQQENRLLKTQYQKTRLGKVNKYLLFLARSLELLSPTGRLSFILPNAWLGIRTAGPIREKLLREQLIEKIVLFEENPFPEAEVETLALFLKREPQKDFSVIRITGDDWNTPNQSSTLSAAHCLQDPDYLIPTHWNGEIASLFDTICQQRLRLGDQESLFLPRIALQAYAKGKGVPPQTAEDVSNHVFDAQKKLGDDYYPYLQGRDIEPFKINWSGTYLRHGKFLAEPQTLERFTGPRILLREITARPPYRLLAAYTDDILLYNKSVLHILPKPNVTEEHCFALLSILSSKLISFFLSFRGRKNQRTLFPKIVNADLKSLPLPDTFSECPSPLSTSARMLIECAMRDDAVALMQARRENDQLVNSAYGLTSDQGEQLSEQLERFSV